MIRTAVASGLLGVVLWLGGCSGQLTTQVEPPEVSLAGLGFGEPGLFEQQLRLDLRVRNPNDFTVDVNGLRFDLAVNELPFARGWSDEGFALPARGETVVPVTVAVPTSDLIERVTELGIAQRLDYRLTGVAELDHLFVTSLPFEREGKLALPRLPGLTPPSS
jgi:LEA14-like dessication related protein